MRIIDMNFANLFKIAVRALSNNKLRGFLTMLGIIIGVASVITMLAIGQGSKKSIQAEISEMGSNMIMIQPGGDMRGGVRQSAEPAEHPLHSRPRRNGSAEQRFRKRRRQDAAERAVF